jgi:uncharacterized protein YbjT (DUF2867 family)
VWGLRLPRTSQRRVPGGVIDAFEPFLAGLLECVADNAEALGRPDVTVPSSVQSLLCASSPGGPLPPTESHELDTYIETQVHGAVDLAADVASLVIDLSFAGTETGSSSSTLLTAMASSPSGTRA